MGSRGISRSAVITAVVFAISVFGLTLYVWRSFGGTQPLQPKGYRFHIPFGIDAVQLTSNADVRISGVNVGKVRKVTPGEGRIDTIVELKRKYAPIPRDARAIVRSKTLLGEAYVELAPGTGAGPKLKEGGTLRVAQIGRAQGLDEVLGAFDKRTRDNFASFLEQLGDTFKDRGPDVNDAIGNLAPAARDTRTLVEVLGRDSDRLRRLVRDTGRALQAAGGRQDDLRTLVRAGETVTSTTAARDARLTEMLHELRPFLREARVTAADLEVTAKAAAPTLAALRPVIPLVRPALDVTSDLAPELRAALVRLNPTITLARSALPAATSIVDAARPLVDILYPAGRELVPVVELVEAYRRDLVGSVSNLAATLQATTATGQHALRALPPLWTEGIVGYGQRLASNRYNPYQRPGGQDDLADGTLRALDCRNTQNPQFLPVIFSAPPCHVAPKWTFRGVTRSFPHVERDGP